MGREAIHQKFFELDMEASDQAFIEIHFPEFGHTVIYSDNMYDSMKGQYIYPSGLLQKYQGT